MAALGGFEPHPRLAVAVSGGADSMALVWLCRRWTMAREGTLIALTVDHRLRPESGVEAAQVGAHLGALGCPHRCLTWDREGAEPRGAIQAAARAARYRLLTEATAAAGANHLLTAHHLDDQAETVLLRLARGSGVDGLAAMAAVRGLGGIRLARPLLAVPKARLIATCTAAGLPYLEDPGNRTAKFARGRLRAVSALLAAEGLTAAGLAETARRAGTVRAALELLTDRLVTQSARLDPQGWLSLDLSIVMKEPEELGLRVLARCLATIGGGDGVPIRRRRLERLFGALRDAKGTGGGHTLGGCRLLWRRDGMLMVVREPAAAVEALAVSDGGPVWWDRRFVVGVGRPEAVLREWAAAHTRSAGGAFPHPPLSPDLSHSPDSGHSPDQRSGHFPDQRREGAGEAVLPWRLAVLGESGAAALIARLRADLNSSTLPPRPVLPSLPALFLEGRPLVLPSLGWTDPDHPSVSATAFFVPEHALCPPLFVPVPFVPVSIGPVSIGPVSIGPVPVVSAVLDLI